MSPFPAGINVIDDIHTQAGVDTLEGRIGPLLMGEACQCHFIEMKPGMYCHEHPHSTESLIFTARGRWVLCSRGQRIEMKPGSLFWFGRDIPTGYEVPYDEPVFLLIFKGERTSEGPHAMMEYLMGLRERLEQKNQEGVPFSFEELPRDHPAVKFSEEVNRKATGG